MGNVGDARTAGGGGPSSAGAGDAVSGDRCSGTAATGTAGRDAGKSGKGKAGSVAKAIKSGKSGKAGKSGVVSSTQAAGTGTRETVRPLPTKRRVRGGTTPTGDIPGPSPSPDTPSTPGEAKAIDVPKAELSARPPRRSRSRAAAPAQRTPAEPASSGDAAALGLARVVLPLAADALLRADRLARAAVGAGEAGELKYRADVLRDILTGRLGDPARLPEHGLDALAARSVTVVVAEPDPLPDDGAATLRRHQDALAAAWVAAVRLDDPEAVVAGYPGETVALVSAPANVGGRGASAAVGRVAAERVRVACARIPRTFTTGISRTVRGLGALPSAYEQARRAVAAGRRLQGPGAVTEFDSLGVFRLLALLPPDGELERFAAEVLGALAEPEDAEAAELRRTLQVLLDTNLNVAETSRRLYVHYNTLRYRIGKLERMVGPFTHDARLRLDLSVALEIVHLGPKAASIAPG